MTKADLEKKILEQEERLLSIISGNITLMGKIEQLESKIKNLEKATNMLVVVYNKLTKNNTK